MRNEVEIQRQYYQEQGSAYDHGHAEGEHEVALAWITASLNELGAHSVLDVGCGTGRAILRISREFPELRCLGVEPVEAMRAAAVAAGLPAHLVQAGDATALDFPDGSFDVVCCFGVLHHIREPRRAVAEMMRVARRAVFISDTNKYGQGSPSVRAVKKAIRLAGLYKAVDFVRSRGRGYFVSEGDGVYYPYSVFDDYPYLAAHVSELRVMNTRGKARNLVNDAETIALLAIK